MTDQPTGDLTARIAAKKTEPAFQEMAKTLSAPVPLGLVAAQVLRDAAAEVAAMDPAEAALAGQYAFHNAAAQLHRRANEAEFVATPCDPMVPCEDGGEPCHVHERLMSHHDGSHELCEPNCGTPAVPAVPVSSPPPDQTAEPTGFVLWLEASDGSVSTHDGIRWPDGWATIRHRHYGHTTTHHSPEAACQATHGKQGRIVWPAPPPADRAAAPVSASPPADYTTDPSFVPPAAEGFWPAVFDSATDGASALDAWARTPHGRNFLAHALAQLARDGWLRTKPGEGFEPVHDRDDTPEPQDPAGLRRLAAEAQQPDTETRA